MGWISDSVRTQRLMATLQNWPRKISFKVNSLRLFTQSPEVNRFGEYRPGESDFTLCTGPTVNRPSAITFENKEKFRSCEQAEHELREEVGGGEGTGVEQSLGRKTLIWNDVAFGARSAVVGGNHVADTDGVARSASARDQLEHARSL